MVCRILNLSATEWLERAAKIKLLPLIDARRPYALALALALNLGEPCQQLVLQAPCNELVRLTRLGDSTRIVMRLMCP